MRRPEPPGLEDVTLFRDGVSDTGLEQLAKMSGLRRLSVRGCNNIAGPGLVHLKNLGNLKTLVLSASVLDILELMNKHLAGLWEHSLATARVSEALANRLRLANPEEIAVAGLLHDLGKVIIAQKFPAEHQQIRDVVASKGCLQVQAEREVLGVTHPEIGMWLLKKWGLPGKLVYPIAFHHAFHPAREFAARTAIVHVADILCRAHGFGYAGDDLVPALSPGAWGATHLSMTDVDDIYAELEDELAELSSQ